jgi:DNA-binding NarL/FixJ family response regulator
VIRILVADDHAVVRKGLRQIISEAPGLTVEDEASTARETLDKACEREFDVLVLDVSMPGGGGLSVLRELKARGSRLPVLVFSIHAEEQYAVRALRAGAAGFLSKDRAPEELVAAIRKVADGGRYVTSSLAERLAFALQDGSDAPPHERLSAREHQVLCLIASGKTVGEIAAELFLSPKTISTYRSRILEKMHLDNNAQLTRYAVENNLVP